MGIAKGKGERGEERGEGGKCSFFQLSTENPCFCCFLGVYSLYEIT